MTNQEWLTFWKKVQEDFLNADDNTEFLCHASKEFEKFWRNFNNVIYVKGLVIEFLKEKNMKMKTSIATEGGFCLFYMNDTDEDRSIRIEFLQWIIEKLEKEI